MLPSNWAHMNIAVKELLPIVLAMQLWGSLMANSRILFMCDNMSIVAVINSHTSKDAHVMRLLRQHMVLCDSYYYILGCLLNKWALPFPNLTRTQRFHFMN